MRRVKPMEFTAEQIEELQKELLSQDVTASVVKSLDPENYPVFEVPVNQKVFVYVPKHNITLKDGSEELRMDKPFIHTIREGNRFSKIRCVRGLRYATNGCPFCDAVEISWDLANEMIKDKYKSKGLNPDDKDDQLVKSIRRECFESRTVKAPVQYYTFPIVLIEMSFDDNKRRYILDENGNLKYKAMWYTISESAYKDKWLKCLESLEDEPMTPGGYTFILDYTYTPKTGEPNKRDSAKALHITPKKLKDFEQQARYFDELTADWDIAKAITTVVDNVLPNYEEMVEEAERVIQPSKDKLAMYRESVAISSESLLGTGDSDDGFNLTDEANGIPVGDTDMDDIDE